MSLTLKLLGPDVPQDFNLTVDSSLTVTQVKEKARSEWPDANTVPTGALRMIHSGKFLPDDKTLKDCRIPEGETTAMHLILKSADAKTSDAPSASDDKTPKCNCVIC
eukprot:CAMPEP_0118817358 /NCGR_PEP_ID=MMETSP1162-20130426/5374_1 /TAXON_ID=33656 /ORGANISM="Phaeocystis Sp, Strain CCMP2710" /LENGTH=106 /DNA_ID=CAMNT_0006747457 /DNA_START=68 /DNA_END=388 /DNA_ORIENTATION=+